MDNKLITVPDKYMPNLSRIVYQNGGPTPDILTGLYTGWTMAQKAISSYNKLKPVHKEQVYIGAKTLTDEEEKEAFKKVEETVEEENQLKEAKDGEEEKSKTTDKDRTEHVHSGSDNGSKSVNVPRKRKS